MLTTVKTLNHYDDTFTLTHSDHVIWERVACYNNNRCKCKLSKKKFITGNWDAIKENGAMLYLFKHYTTNLLKFYQSHLKQ